MFATKALDRTTSRLSALLRDPATALEEAVTEARSVGLDLAGEVAAHLIRSAPARRKVDVPAIRAAQLARELQLAAAAPALVRCLERLPPSHPLCHVAQTVLPHLGAAAVEALLSALERCDSSEARARLAEILALTPVEDDRIRAALVRMLDDDPSRAARFLADRCEWRALPDLVRTVERIQAEPLDCDICTGEALGALALAVGVLGGALRPSKPGRSGRCSSERRRRGPPPSRFSRCRTASRNTPSSARGPAATTRAPAAAARSTSGAAWTQTRAVRTGAPRTTRRHAASTEHRMPREEAARSGSTVLANGGSGGEGFSGHRPCGSPPDALHSGDDGPGATPPASHEEFASAVDALVDECRSVALWFLKPDYYPRTDDERRRVLARDPEARRPPALQARGEVRAMALTALQRRVCLLLADQRKRSGESYVAGGVALNELVSGARRSRDIDLFHDTEAALAATWSSDRAELAAAGLRVETVRELPAFVEARVSDGAETVLVQWAQDSAFRFFPLVEHELFGLTLHPVDLATNKLLAVIGRREVRDWVDIVKCHDEIQPLGYLAWAAAGKDPGFSPLRIVEECARVRYVQTEIDSLDFDGPVPRAADLSSRWHAAIAELARSCAPSGRRRREMRAR